MSTLKKMKLLGVAAAMGASLLLAGTAQASYGTVTAKFIDRDPTGYTGGIFTFQRLAGDAGGTFAGTLLPNTPAGTFYGICLEVNETIASNSTHTWTVKDVAAAPVDAAGFLPLAGGMGAAKAESLAKLVTRALGGSISNAFSLSATQQVALQMAVWEIVYETAGTFDVLAGNFRTTAGSAPALIPNYATDMAGATAQANTWLTGLAGFTAAKNLYALTLDGTQDFLVQTPIPAAVWLLGSGLLGLFGISRRRQRKGLA